MRFAQMQQEGSTTAGLACSGAKTGCCEKLAAAAEVGCGKLKSTVSCLSAKRIWQEPHVGAQKMLMDDAELADLGVAVGAKSFDFGVASLLCSNFEFHGAEAAEDPERLSSSRAPPPASPSPAPPLPPPPPPADMVNLDTAEMVDGCHKGHCDGCAEEDP